MKHYCVFLFLLTFLLGIQPTRAQFQKPDVSMPSPNAASLGLYGEVPVSLYTGLPSIEIPIHTIEEGKIKVPISLSYHASGVRVNQHPGWVGLNWNLNAGGAITRVVQGFNDENSNNFGNGNYGYFYRSNVLNQPNWNTKAGVVDILNGKIISGDFYDTEPDEFSFQFQGFSGKFYRNHLGKWQVVSEEAIQVDELPILPLPVELQNNYRNSSIPLQNTFGGFVLTVPDGTKYFFGGSTTAIEYSIPFFEQQRQIWLADTWFLTRIRTPEGQEVNFSYAPKAENDGRFIVSFHHSFQAGSDFVDFYGGSSLFLGGNVGVVSYKYSFDYVKYAGSLIRPTYLARIDHASGSVRFDCSNSTELTYPSRVLEGYVQWAESWDPTHEAIKFLNSDAFIYLGAEDYTGIQGVDLYSQIPVILGRMVWQQLDRIVVRQKDTGQSTIRTIDLNYSASPSHRLTLQKVSQSDNTGCQINHDLSYYDQVGLPEYFDAYDQTDHWGFFNMNTAFLYQDIGANITNYFAHKQPSTDINVLNAGSLQKIKYPTGGTTEFLYEPHTIYKYKVVNPDGSLGLDWAASQAVGGLRIRRITSNDSATSQNRNYSYEWNNGSSGISSGIHKYNWLSRIQYVKNSTGGFSGNYVRDYFKVNNTLPMSANSLGSHVGYREVKETLGDGSQTVYTFTNYESDDGTHMDDNILNANKIGSEGAIYDPQIDKSAERGKPLSESHFAMIQGIPKLVKKKSITYQKLSEKFVRSVRADQYRITQVMNSQGNNQPVIAYLGFPYGFHAYQYKPQQVDIDIYDQTDPALATSDRTEYLYNADGLPVEVKILRSGGYTRTKTRHVGDYDFGIVAAPTFSDTQAALIHAMRQRGMVGRPVEQQVWNNEAADGQERMTGGYLNTYHDYSTAAQTADGHASIQVQHTRRFVSLPPPTGVALSTVTNAGGSFAFAADARYTKTEVEFPTDATAYTERGEPKRFRGSDGLWTTLTWGDGPETGRLKSQAVGPLTTTFEYAQPLVGVSKITDPTGNWKSFEYDGFNRLLRVRDRQNRVLKSYRYFLTNSSGCL